MKHRFKIGDVITSRRMITIKETGRIIKVLNQHYYLKEVNDQGGLSGMFNITFIDSHYELDPRYLVYKMIGIKQEERSNEKTTRNGN